MNSRVIYYTKLIIHLEGPWNTRIKIVLRDQIDLGSNYGLPD